MLNEWSIFIISLSDAKKRRARLTAKLSSHGLEWEVFEAVDGRNGLPEKYQSMVDRDGMVREFGRMMSDAECACAISHQLVYKEIVQQRLPGAVILEDDTIWTKQASILLSNIAPGEYDFLQMDYGWADFWRFYPKERIKNSNIKIGRLARNAGLANAYIVSRKAAQYIMEHGLPLKFTPDWPCSLRPLMPLATVPRLCQQADGGVEASSLLSGRESEKRTARQKVFGTSKDNVPRRLQGRNPYPKVPRILFRLLTKTIRPEV